VRAFVVGAGGAAGVTRGRTRSKDLIAPFRGVRAPREQLGDALSARRAMGLLLGPQEALSHLTAARHLGMRTPQGHAVAGPVHVTTYGGRPVRRAGVVAHRGHATCARVEVDGVRLSHPTETWLHLAASLDLDDLVVMGDGLVRRRRPDTTPEGLRAAFAAHPRLVGAQRIREALEAIRPGTDSARETLLRLLIVRAGFPEPEINGEIRDGRGVVVAHGDLVWRDARLIVEYDGDHHRTDREQWSIDIDRIGRLQALGWTVIRVDAALYARSAVLFSRLRTAFSHP